MGSFLEYDSSHFIVIYKILINSWIIFLNIRQLLLIVSLKEVPSYAKGFYSEIHLSTVISYQCEKILLTLIFRFYETFVFIAQVYGGVIPILWTAADEIGPTHELKVSAFIALSSLFETVVYLPIKFFNLFVIERRYGFNKQPAGSFISETFQEIFAKTLISFPVVWGTLTVMRLKPDVYQYYLMVFMFIFRVALIVVYLEFIFPLLATFNPLPAGRLRNKISDLAAKVNFPLYDIYVMQASHRTTHGNAFFIGLGSKKMIVFFDTMLEGYTGRFLFNKKRYTENELLGILGHEMGHWYHQHILKALLVFQAITCIEIYLCASMVGSKRMYTAVGFHRNNLPPIYMGFLMISPIFLAPIGTIAHYGSRWISRYFELEADIFSANLNQRDGLLSGLTKLSSESLKLPMSDALYSAWYDTHPTLEDRIKNLLSHEIQSKDEF